MARRLKRKSHDYTPVARPIETEEEEVAVVPRAEKKLPFYVCYALPGDQMDGSGRVERVEALNPTQACRVLLEKFPEALHMLATQATIVLYWRPKGTTEKWDSFVQTDTYGGKTFQQEIDLIDWIQEDFTQKPYLFGSGFDIVPEWKRVEYQRSSGNPEEL